MRFFKLLIVSFILFGSTIIFSSNSYNQSNEIGNTSSNAWHFISLGDTRQEIGDWDNISQSFTTDNASSPKRAAIFNSIIENNPNLEFIIHTGDMTKSGGEQDDWNRYYEDIENVTKNNIPIYYAVGNHERYNYAYGEGLWAPPDNNFSVYLSNVELPGNERYYSFDFDNQIHFIFINTDEFWEGGDEGTFNITTEQFSWISSDLKSNSIEFAIAVFHRPCYSIRRPSRVLAAQEIRRVLEPLFITHGVDLVFSGHDHYYYRTTRHGITHVVTGGGGAELAINGDLSEWQEYDVYFSDYHYCNVSVTDNGGKFSVKTESHRLDLKTQTSIIADSFTIEISTESSTNSTSVTVPIIVLFLGTLTVIVRKQRHT